MGGQAHVCGGPPAAGRLLKTEGGGPSSKIPPPLTKVTIVGKNEIYNWENLVGPFLARKPFGSQTPSPPPPPPTQKTPCPAGVMRSHAGGGGRGAPGG